MVFGLIKNYKHGLLFIGTVMASLVVYTQLFMPSKKHLKKQNITKHRLASKKSLVKDSLSLEQANRDSLTALRETKTHRVEEFITDTGLYWLIQEIDKFNHLAQRAKDLQLQ